MQRRRFKATEWCALVLLFAVLLACKKKGAQDQAPPGPSSKAQAVPQVVWSDKDLKLKGHPGEGHFYMSSGARGEDPLFLNAYFSNFPEGTEFTLGDNKGTASKSGYFSTRVDLRETITKLPLRTILNSDVDLDVPITIKLPNLEPARAKVPALSVKNSVSKALAKVIDQPVVFGQAESKNPLDTVVFASATGLGKLRVIGPAETLSRVDWIALAEPLARAELKKCTGYKEKGTVMLQVVDSQVTIYDRRSGDRVAQTTLRASDDCPRFAFVSSKGTTKSYVRDEDVDRWLRAELQKAKAQDKSGSQDAAGGD